MTFQSFKLFKNNISIILTIFNKEKIHKFSFDCYNTLTNGIAIFEFFVNIINDLDFTIILYFFLLHTILVGKY